VLLDQTAGMGRQDRWTNVKRGLFRFIDLLPVGSRLNMVAFGDSTREVLPTTTVTELNRDGLFGRIPRRNPKYTWHQYSRSIQTLFVKSQTVSNEQNQQNYP
jgi:hypothetical protein